MAKKNGKKTDGKKEIVEKVVPTELVAAADMAGNGRHAAIEKAVREILLCVGEDPEREGLLNTPRRIARMYDEILAGYDIDPIALVNDALFTVEYDEMVLVKDIEFFSMCLPSRQLVDAVGGQKRAADIQVGDELYTLHEGQRTRTRVTSILTHKARELVELTPGRPDGSLGTPIQLTPDHPIMTPNGWREAGALQAGDCIEYAEPSRASQRRYPVQEGYNLGYVLGTVASDASIQDGRRISLSVREESFAQQFAQAFAAAFPGTNPQIEPIQVPSGFLQRDVPMYRVRVVSSYIGQLMLNWFGSSGPKKETKSFHFPQVVRNSKEMMQGFLDGYIEGDGCKAGASGRMITSSNEQFLHELGAVIETKTTPAGNGMYRMYVPDRWAQAGWYGRHGFSPEVVPYELRDSSFVPVAEVRRKVAYGKKPYTVYSFQCDPYPTFCVSGVLTHNCEHHMLPFFGRAHVAYTPCGKVIGLSKIPRIVEMFARRLQVQERMTRQVAELLDDILKPYGVGVVIEASHMCSMMRGVKKEHARMVTSTMLGAFKEKEKTRNEFLSHLRSSTEIHI